MSAYVIVDIEIIDPSGYEEYKLLAPATVKLYGGKYIARGGPSETLEGDWKANRLVILEFESVDKAKAWLNSPEYAPARSLRHQTARANMVVVEGALNKDLGSPLALGRTAELYTWEEGTVLILFHNWFDLDDIRFEQRMAQTVYTSGLPVPVAGGIIRVKDRNGLVYERVDGVCMWEKLAKQPQRLFAFARKTAEMHAEMHSNILRPDLPSQRSRLERKINAANPLSAHLKLAILSGLSELPDGSSICHGDFHPGNILLTPTRAVIFDWIDASLGNPLADVARTTVIILGSAASSQVPNAALKVSLRLFHSIYIRHYFHLRPGGEAEYCRWLPVIAASRLSENIVELERWLLNQAKIALEEYSSTKDIKK